MTDAVNVTYQILQVKKDIRNRESYIDTLQRSGGVCFDVIVYFLCQYVLAWGAFWLPLHLAKGGAIKHKLPVQAPKIENAAPNKSV